MAREKEEAFPPDWQIDLHGHTVEQALRRLRSAVQDCRHQRYRWLRVITGRGQRSPQGQGRLGQALSAWLRQSEARALGVESFVEGSKGGSLEITISTTPPRPT